MGANKVIPFSSFQRYQREDSAWANDLIPELAVYLADALPNWPEIIPAFVRVDCETDEITPLNPRRAPRTLKKPEDFGDSWSDPLTDSDKEKIRRYFMTREVLRDHFGFIEVSAGKSTVTVDLNSGRPDIGIKFECDRPRDSGILQTLAGDLVDCKHLHVPQQHIRNVLLLASLVEGADEDDVHAVAGEHKTCHPTHVIDAHGNGPLALIQQRGQRSWLFGSSDFAFENQFVPLQRGEDGAAAPLE